MRVHILGPLEVEVDGRPLRIGGPREHIVLATLALRPNRVASTDQLVDAVWGENPPPTARGQIQGCISALRKLFAQAGHPEAIGTRASGYLLAISEDDLDSTRFHRLVADAHASAEVGLTADAADLLGEALSMWRGAALQGLHSDALERGAAVLDDARLAAVEERLQVHLDLGRHLEVVSELRTLVDDYPLRERFYAFLMLALYRAGRQADALEIARRARTTLIDEIGIEPGNELQNLERDILNRDPRLDIPAQARRQPEPVNGAAAPPTPGGEAALPEAQDRSSLTSPQQLPRATADFVGRREQVAAITRLLTEPCDAAASHYALPIIGICGSGGVGKSTLALRVAHGAASAYPDGHLYVDLQGPAVEDRATGLLGRLLRALGVSGVAIPEDIDERAELYRSRLAGKRMLLVFDGVTSERQILPFLPGEPSCAVIVTSRTRLDFLAGAHWFPLDVFDTATSLELLTSVIGAERLEAEPQAAQTLVAYAGGLPLALRIAGARLASRPQWRIAELTRRMKNEVRRLDEFSYRGLELRSSIGSSFRSLSDQAKRLFRLCALMQAPDFPGWTAAALLDSSLAEAERILDLLVDVHLLDLIESVSGRPRYRFHDLIRVFALERLIATETEDDRRNALGRLFGAWLELADRAHRREYGGDFTILHGSAPRFEIADLDEAEPEDDPALSPLTWLENERGALVAAVRQAAQVGMDDVSWDLALTLVSLLEVKGLYDDWRETAVVAMAACERAGNTLGRAAMAYSLGTLCHAQKQLDDSSRYFDVALAGFRAAGSAHGEALTLRNAALVDRLHGNTAAMLAKFDAALSKMRAAGDLIGEANILRSRARFWIEQGEPDRASGLLSEALELCRRAGYVRGTAQVESSIAEMYLATGETTLARQTLNRVLATVQQLGDRVGEAHALYWLGLVRQREGLNDTAETTLANALTAATQAGEQLICGQVEYALGELAIARGDHVAAGGHLTRARELFAQLGSAVWLAKTLLLLFEVADSGTELDASAEQHLGEAMELLAAAETPDAGRLREQLVALRGANEPLL